MYCSFCGKEIPDQSTFCGYCGKKLVYIGDQPDDDSYEEYDQEVASWFGVPSWGYYEEEWDEETTPAEEVVIEESDGADAEGDPEEGVTESSNDASDAEATEGEGADTPEAEGSEAPESGEGAADAASDEGDEASDGEEADESEPCDRAAAALDDGDVPVPGEPAFGPVRPAMRPLSRDAFADAASGGVYVPQVAAAASRKRGIAAPAVVGIAAAALIVGAAGAFALAGPFSPFAPSADGEEPAATQTTSSDGAAAGKDAAGAGDAAGSGDAAVAPEETEAPSDGDAAEDAAAQTGFSSAKKLVAALETPLYDALGERFSHATMRLLVIDELDFMVPAYAEALAREAGFSTVKEFARNAEDTEASQFGDYAGTWSFALARGSKCSARTVERMERQCQLLGVDLAIDKAYKIEAVTSNYPSDYQSDNVDDEGLYHKVTPYTAIQVDGRWYLYTDALAPVKSDDEA